MSRILVLAWASVLGGLPLVSAQEKPWPIGFVDMERLIEEHPDTARQIETLKRGYDSKVEVLRNNVSELNGLKEAMEVLAVGAPDQIAQQKRIATMEATLELDRQLARAEMELGVVKALRSIYSRCVVEVAAVAKERGLIFVSMYSNAEVRGRTRNELVGDILTRPFVYKDDRYDITDEVLKRLGK